MNNNTVREIVKNRSEFIFLYDVKWNNPNGDPLNDNKPRIDDERGINIVTDVRLKRTIRDYLKDYLRQDIFVWTEIGENGMMLTKEEMVELKKIVDADTLLRMCVDIRLFGAVIAISSKNKKGKNATSKEEGEIEKKPIKFTGPVQMNMGQSLHKVETKILKGTTVFPSKDEKGTGTFSWKYVLPYSLICFHGVINEVQAKNTTLTTDDVKLMYDAMWHGTKALHSCSKNGHMPRMIIEVVYKESAGHIGDLDKKIKLILNYSNVDSEIAIRGTGDYYLDMAELRKELDKNKDIVQEVRVRMDSSLNCMNWYPEEEIVKF